MSSFQYEKTLSFSFKKKKEPISAKKYLLAKDDENQKYAVFQLTNNYKETVNRIVLIINQYDKNGTFLTKNEVPYENLSIKSNNKFVPFFKLVLDEQTEKMETQVVEADFENHKYLDGKMYRVKKEKKPKAEVEVKPKDTVDKDVKVLKSKFPAKSFLIMSAIVLVIMGIFIGIFSLSNPEIMYEDMAFNTATGTVVQYYGNSKIVTIPEKIKGKEVLAINNRAFINKSVISVTIESENIIIGEYAFANNNNLQTFNAKNVSEVGKHAFENCKFFTTFNAEKVNVIREGAFRNCQSLTVFNSNDCTRIESQAFVDCYSLKEVNTPKAKLTSSVFENNAQLNSLTFNGIEGNTIVTLAMIFSNYKDHDDLVVNVSADTISSDFFRDFKYRRLNFTNPEVKFTGTALDDYINAAKAKSAYYDAGAYQKAFDVIVSFDAAKIGETLVINDSSLKGIIKKDLTSVATKIKYLEINASVSLNYSFMSMFTNVTELRLGPLVNVEDGAISLLRLNKLTMPVIGTSFKKLFSYMPSSFELELNGTTDVPEKYLDEATTLTKLTISGNIKKVGKYAVSKCPRLQEVVIGNNVTTMELPIIDNSSTMLRTVSIPFVGSSSGETGRYIDVNESGGFTNKLTISSTVALMYNVKAFENCVMLNTLVIDGGVIGEATGLFTPLKGLKKLSLGGSYGQSLGVMANGMAIENVAINSSSLPNMFFSNCQVTNIFFMGYYHFVDTLFTASDNVTNIYVSRNSYKDNSKQYKDIFDKVIFLKNIYFENSSTYYDGTKTAQIGYDIQSVYDSTFN